jgi:hypothetical protein
MLMPSYARKEGENGSKLEGIVVTITNNGTQPQALTEVGIMRKRRFRKPLRLSAGSVGHRSKYLRLEPGATQERFLSGEMLLTSLKEKGVDPNSKLTVYVLTPDGKRFESDPRRFDQSL